jgi:hypothetical protein
LKEGAKETVELHLAIEKQQLCYECADCNYRAAAALVRMAQRCMIVVALMK